VAPDRVSSTERTAEYRRRRWAHLEELVRRVVREELDAVDGRRMGGGRAVDIPRGPGVDNVTRGGARPVMTKNPVSFSGSDYVGDAPTWSAEDELFPGFRRPELPPADPELITTPFGRARRTDR
jgi:hypothetical protein